MDEAPSTVRELPEWIGATPDTAIPPRVKLRVFERWGGLAPCAVNLRKTHCIRGHEFTPENTMQADGYRHCRACSRLREGWQGGQHGKDKVACKRGHSFSPENTRIIAGGRRRCLTCDRDLARARYHGQVVPR